MKIDEIIDILKNVYVPSMDVWVNSWGEETGAIGISLYEPNILRFNSEIGEQEDALWNSIRFGFCEAVHAGITAWLDQGGHIDDDNLPEVLRALVYSCAENPNPANVPWYLFRVALACAWPEDLLLTLEETVRADSDSRWELEVRHTVEAAPDGVSYQITTEIGGGWQEMWIKTFSFTVSKYATREAFVKAAKTVYPAYLMQMEDENG